MRTLEVKPLEGFLENLRRLNRLTTFLRTVLGARRLRGNLTPCRFANFPQEGCLRILRFRDRNPPLPERNRFRPGIRTENQDKLQERRDTCYTNC